MSRCKARLEGLHGDEGWNSRNVQPYSTTSQHAIDLKHPISGSRPCPDRRSASLRLRLVLFDFPSENAEYITAMLSRGKMGEGTTLPTDCANLPAE